jgi:hypothetical protein
MSKVDTTLGQVQADPVEICVRMPIVDFETVLPEDFGASLKGLGVNLLVRDVALELAFLETVFEIKGHRISADFAIVTYRDNVFQLHADGTYHSNPLLGLLPENPPRGAGIELHLFETDPDIAVRTATEHDYVVLQAPTNKPHGLREAYILSPDGYAWVPSRPLTTSERS